MKDKDVGNVGLKNSCHHWAQAIPAAGKGATHTGTRFIELVILVGSII